MTANTVASRKNKGRTLQKKVVELILKENPQLTERDVKSTSMGCSGDDILLSEAALRKFPFSVECKNTEKINIWQAIEQAESRKKDSITPLVVFKRNRSDIYCTLKFEDLLRIYDLITE